MNRQPILPFATVLFGTLAIVSSGCLGTPNLAQPTGTLICASDNDCPRGMSCSQGLCGMGNVKGNGGTSSSDSQASGSVDAGPSGPTPTPGGGATTPSALCKSCTSNADCGGKGICIPDGPSSSGPAQFCGLDCSSASCPAGTTCYSITDGSGAVVGQDCWPTSGYCSGFSGVGACAGSSQCPVGYTCSGGACTSTTGGGTPIPTPTPEAGTSPSPTPAPDAGTSSSSGPCGGHTWANTGQAYMDNYCDGCHSSMASYSGVKRDANRIESYIQDGSMPPGGNPQPSAAENDAIIQWINCGTPM